MLQGMNVIVIEDENPELGGDFQLQSNDFGDMGQKKYLD